MRLFFTIPDPDLTQETSIDPMGIQPIWIHYGQILFGDKLTTVANDARVFTFNLFHHYIIFDLFQQHAEEIQSAKAQFKAWQTESDIKAGLLIFLEDLVTHIFYLQPDDDPGIEKIGILGVNKARFVHNTKSPDSIYLVANKRNGVLKNQINLGMTGRYKGPMMNMLYFDRSFTYIPQTWELVNKLLNRWKDAVQLKESLTKLIVQYLLQSGRKDSPQLSLQEIKSTRLWKPISEGYLGCFGKRKLPKLIQDYWKDHLGLNSGAPAVLYGLIAKLDDSQPISHEKMLQDSLKLLNKEPGEQLKVQRILDIEPFLSYSEYLLRFLAQPSVKKLGDVKAELADLRSQILAASHFELDNTLPRLTELVAAMRKEGTLEEWLQSALTYHRNISIQRGGNSWVELDPEGNFMHFYAPRLNENLNTVSKYLKDRTWWHTYYLETLRSIYNGIQ